jgi:hypothetical protein
MGAIGDSFALEIELASPFAMVMIVPTEVQTGTEMEAGIAKDLDLEVAGRSIAHRGKDLTALESAI